MHTLNMHSLHVDKCFLWGNEFTLQDLYTHTHAHLYILTVLDTWRKSCLNWRRQWRPTPVLLPGKSHGQGEPGGLHSMGSSKVGHDWATSLSRFTFMHWRRKWQPTPVFLPGEPQGWGSLVGCRLWGRTESDTTEVT